MYRERMTNYYPPVIQGVAEFKSIIDSEYPEFEALSEGKDRIISEAYLLTMTEDRIKEWEKAFSIRPLEDSTLEDRRETILARIRGQGKLNSKLIETIVKTFTGGTAKSYIEDGVLYVKISPPSANKQYRFENVEQEIAKKIPAHLGFDISREYVLWDNVNHYNDDWLTVRKSYATWYDLLIGSAQEAGKLDVTPLMDFVLD